MDGIQIREVPPDRLEEFLLPIMTAMGSVGSAEQREELLGLPEFDLRLGAWDDDTVVAGLGGFAFDLTVPGGVVPTAGVTMVGVHATHRRQGILTALMRAQLDSARERKQPLAALWATEGGIYGRYGYGLASLAVEFKLDRDRASFIEADEPQARVRLVDEHEALELMRPVWEAARRERPGMFSRSREWWERRRLADPISERGGTARLQRAVVELDGQVRAYALYRQHGAWEELLPAGQLEVIEAIAATPAATRALWRYLIGIDLVRWLKYWPAPIDHPLVFALEEPGRLRMRAKDGLWIRLIDVEDALARRGYREGGGVVLEVHDEFCPWNEGRFRITHEGGRRTDYEPDVRLGASELGSAYLGGFTFAALQSAGRLEELRPGGVDRADQLFAVDRAPWCPEIF